MGHSFGKSSIEKLETCHEDIQKIMYRSIEISRIDFGIAEGHRPIKVQQEYFAIGRTKELHRKPITNIDGIDIVGKHNKIPSEAVDIYIWHPDKKTRQKIAYDGNHLAYVMGIIAAVAYDMYEHKLISHKIRWGGNWDGDGIIKFDQRLIDFPHVEIIDP